MICTWRISGKTLLWPRFDRQPRVDPALRAAFDQHAAVNPGPFELFNRLAGASARLAEHIDRLFPAAALLLKGGRIEVVERDQLRARHMRGGELPRRADIEQLGGAAFRQQAVKFERLNGSFGLQGIHNRCMNI